jgi:hypothetical protein
MHFMLLLLGIFPYWTPVGSRGVQPILGFTLLGFKHIHRGKVAIE